MWVISNNNNNTLCSSNTNNNHKCPVVICNNQEEWCINNKTNIRITNQEGRIIGLEVTEEEEEEAIEVVTIREGFNNNNLWQDQCQYLKIRFLWMSINDLSSNQYMVQLLHYLQMSIWNSSRRYKTQMKRRTSLEIRYILR
jgi:hypothetical protein